MLLLLSNLNQHNQNSSHPQLVPIKNPIPINHGRYLSPPNVRRSVNFSPKQNENPITQLAYGSSLTNTYIQISKILWRATSCLAHLKSAPPVISPTSVPTPTYHTITEKRVLLTPPPADPEPRVQPVPSPSPVQALRP